MSEQIRNAAERFADKHQQEQRELLVGSVRYRSAAARRAAIPTLILAVPAPSGCCAANREIPFVRFIAFPLLCAFLLCTVWHKPGGLGTLHPLAGRRTCPLHGRFLNVFGESEKFLENAVTFCRPVHITLQRARLPVFTDHLRLTDDHAAPRGCGKRH